MKRSSFLGLALWVAVVGCSNSNNGASDGAPMTDAGNVDTSSPEGLDCGSFSVPVDLDGAVGCLGFGTADAANNRAETSVDSRGCSVGGFCQVPIVGAEITITDIAGFWGTAADDIWAVGIGKQTPTLWHWNGDHWEEFWIREAPYYYDVTYMRMMIWGTKADDVWATGVFGEMFHWDGVAWNRFSPAIVRGGQTCNVYYDPNNYSLVLYSRRMWGTSDNDLWVPDCDGADHWDGTKWTSVRQPFSAPDPAPGFTAIWGSSSTDVWVAGMAGQIFHGDGTGFVLNSQPAAYDLHDIWGASANDIWAVGAGGEVVHWDGTTWTTSIVTGADLFSVWGSSSTDVWAVGVAGTIIHWDGTQWLPYESGTAQDLHVVWGTSAHQVWVGGHGVNAWVRETSEN